MNERLLRMRWFAAGILLATTLYLVAGASKTHRQPTPSGSPVPQENVASPAPAAEVPDDGNKRALTV